MVDQWLEYICVEVGWSVGCERVQGWMRGGKEGKRAGVRD